MTTKKKAAKKKAAKKKAAKKKAAKKKAAKKKAARRTAGEPVFLLGYALVPGPAHPGRETHGDAFAVCWIPATTIEEADEAAREELVAQRWDVLSREHATPVVRAPRAEDREHFEDARAGTPVHIVHESPRWPVYRVTAGVRRAAETATAHFLVTGTSVVDEEGGEADLYDADFWSVERARRAKAAAREHLEAAGWTVGPLGECGPVSHRTIEPGLQECYDEAEEDGWALAVVGPTKPKRR